MESKGREAMNPEALLRSQKTDERVANVGAQLPHRMSGPVGPLRFPFLLTCHYEPLSMDHTQ